MHKSDKYLFNLKADELSDFAAEGASVAEWAAELGVSRPTVDYWASNIDRFSEVFTRAKALEQAWWERTGRENLKADKFNSAIWSKTMSGRFRRDYAPLSEQARAAEEPVSQRESNLDVSKLTFEQCEALASIRIVPPEE